MTRPAAATALAILVLTTLTSLPSATAQTAPSAPGSLVVASQTAWVQPGGEFGLRLKVATAENPADLQIDLAVHSRVSSRGQFRQTLDGKVSTTVLRSTSAPLTKLPLDAAGAIQVRLGPEDLGATRTGVYPVEVTLRKRRARVPLDRLITHLVSLPATIDGPRLRLGIVLPIHALPALQPDGSVVTPDSAGPEALVEALQAPPYAMQPLTLLPTPETIEAFAAGDEGDRALIAGLRDGLAGRTVVAGPYVTVDVPALDAAGLGTELAKQRQMGAVVLASTLGTQPDERTWVVDDRLDSSGLDRLATEGIDHVVVPERRLVAVRNAGTPTAAFPLQTRARSVLALAADEGLATDFGRDGDQVLAAHRLLADLAVVWLDSPTTDRVLVAAAPRSWTPTRPFLDALLSGLGDSPIVAVTSLDSLYAQPEGAPAPPARTLVAPPRLSPSGLSGSAVTGARNRLLALASTLPERPGDTLDTLERRILVSESSDVRAGSRRPYLNAVTSAVSRQLGSIEVPGTRSITLTARTGDIPLTFRNTSDRTMTVVARVKSDKLRFGSNGVQQVSLPARKSTTVRFAVRARTSGTFPVEVSLVSPQGSFVLATTRFTIRSTAASGIGLGLSVGAALFLAGWWARHLVRGRRARALVPA